MEMQSMVIKKTKRGDYDNNDQSLAFLNISSNLVVWTES